jgi:hypothetical protein
LPARASARASATLDAKTSASVLASATTSTNYVQPPPLPGADTLQLALWLPQYIATPPPKYFGDSDPRNFLMCFEAAIASLGGNETTLAKPFIISLEGATVNWYAR